MQIRTKKVRAFRSQLCAENDDRFRSHHILNVNAIAHRSCGCQSGLKPELKHKLENRSLP